MSADKPPNGVMRDALQHMLSQFHESKPSWALFTTFTFASGFFENNVLPLVVGMSMEELKGIKLVRADLNEALSSIRVVVACDRSASPSPKGDLRYGLLPVGLERGRFHPKIMLMGGRMRDDPDRLGLWLSVSSGNLSLSGWGIQREVAGVVNVSQQHSAELQPLVRWLLSQAQAHARMAERDDAQAEGTTEAVLADVLAALGDTAQLSTANATAPTLHLAWPPALCETKVTDAPRRDLMTALTGQNGPAWDSAVVVSPYWAGVDQLAARLGAERCMLVPTTPQGKFLRPAGLSGSYSYGYFAHEPSSRPSHAKAIQLSRGSDHVLCIGSANFTTAAWMHGAGRLSNVEAMLRYTVKGNAPWQHTFTPADCPDLSTDEDPDAEGAPSLPPFDAEAVCDWHKGQFVVNVRVHEGATLETARLAIGEQKAKVRVGRNDLDVQTFRFEMKGLRLVKTFQVFHTARGATENEFTGLVIQLDAPDDALGYRPRPKIDSVLQFLRDLRETESPEAARKRGDAGTGANEEDGSGDESREPSLDLFAFFQATFQMRRYHARHPAVDPWNASSPFGPQVLYRAISLQRIKGEAAQIALYVQLTEMLATIDALPATPETSEDNRRRLRAAVQADVDASEIIVTALARCSPLFKRMFPKSSPEKRSGMLIQWFRDEMSAAHA